MSLEAPNTLQEPGRTMRLEKPKLPEIVKDLELIDATSQEFQAAVNEFAFQQEGYGGWYAAEEYPSEPGVSNMKNIVYFVIRNTENKIIALVGKYDSGEYQNITHTAVHPDYRGQGLAPEIKDMMADKLGLESLVGTVDNENFKSLASMRRWGGVKQEDQKYAEQGKSVFVKKYIDSSD